MLFSAIEGQQLQNTNTSIYLCQSINSSSSLRWFPSRRWEGDKRKDFGLKAFLTIKKGEKTCRQFYRQICAIQQYHSALHDILVTGQPLVLDLRRGGLAADAARPSSRQEPQHPGSSWGNQDARSSTIDPRTRRDPPTLPLFGDAMTRRQAMRCTRLPLAKLVECEIPRRPHRASHSTPARESRQSGRAARQ